MSIKKVKLGELCTIEKGKIGISKAIPGEYPLVVTAEERLSHNEFHFEGNAVVIPLVSSSGHGHRSLKRIHFQQGRFAVGSILCVVIPRDENILRADYLYRFLDLNKEEELVGRMRGMANVSLPMSEIGEIEIPLPPVKEQEAFVKRYSKLEKHSFEIGDELTHQLSLVKQLRQAFLREAMQGKLVPQRPEDGHAKDLLAQIKAEKAKLGKKEKPLPPITPEEIPFEIPEGWVWCRLGEVCTLITDGKHGDANNQSNSGYYFLSAKDIQNGKFVYEGARQITYADFIETHRRTNLEPGDLCIVNTGATIGKTAFAPENELTFRTTFQKSVAVIKVIKSLTSMKFVEFFIINETPKLLKVSRGSAINNLLLGDLKNVLMPFPPLQEQYRIVEQIEKILQNCEDLAYSILEGKTETEQLLQQVLREALSS